MLWIWSTLGIEPTEDRDAIRRAYARRLKSTNPEDDAEGFQALRRAYEMALNVAEAQIFDQVFVDMTIREAERHEPKSSETERPTSPEPVEDTPTAPRPAPDLSSDELERRMGRLVRLLDQGADTAGLKTGLDDLMAAPALEDLGVFIATEQRLAELILARGPDSDRLIGPAMAAFDWRWERAGVIAPGAEAVLRREEAVRFWRLNAAPRHPDHPAYLALTEARPGWRNRLKLLLRPPLAGQVRRLLRTVDEAHPNLRPDLDPTAEAWWRDYDAQPRTSPWAIYFIVPTALLTALIAAATWSDRPLAWVMGLTFLAVLASGAAMVAGGLWGVARPRRWWTANRSWRAGVVERLGWAPASWLLLLVAAVAPNHPLVVALIAVLALVIVDWCLIVGRPDTRPGTQDWTLRMLLTQAPLVAWWLFLLSETPGPPSPGFSIAMLAALVAGAAGAGGLIDWYHGELQPRWRFLALTGVTALGLASAVAIWAYVTQGLWQPVMMAIAASFILAQRPVVAWLSAEKARLRYYITYFGLIATFIIATNAGGPVAAWATGWLIAGAAAGVVMARFET